MLFLLCRKPPLTVPAPHFLYTLAGHHLLWAEKHPEPQLAKKTALQRFNTKLPNALLTLSTNC